jgi:hypothetical protein
VRLVLRSLGLITWHLLRILPRLGRKDRAWVPSALNVADSLGTIAGAFQIPNRHYRPKDIAC